MSSTSPAGWLMSLLKKKKKSGLSEGQQTWLLERKQGGKERRHTGWSQIVFGRSRRKVRGLNGWSRHQNGLFYAFGTDRLAIAQQRKQQEERLLATNKQTNVCGEEEVFKQLLRLYRRVIRISWKKEMLLLIIKAILFRGPLLPHSNEIVQTLQTLNFILQHVSEIKQEPPAICRARWERFARHPRRVARPGICFLQLIVEKRFQIEKPSKGF